jgi:hypothetical protein
MTGLGLLAISAVVAYFLLFALLRSPKGPTSRDHR